MKPVSKRFRLTIAYDGTAYAGWQVQLSRPTIQDTLEKTLEKIVGTKVKVHSSGRTDQGVHAHGQVAHVDLVTRMDAGSVLRALNSRIPLDIRVLKSSLAKPDFHARRSAISKEYRYFVWHGPIMPPHKRLYAAHVYRPLNLTAMSRAAHYFVGEHDFSSFTAHSNQEVETTVRTITMFTVRATGNMICLRVRGTGFLYKQVRSMVGFLLRVGEGAEPPEAVRRILEHRLPRSERVPTAPAHGLFLWQVWY